MKELLDKLSSYHLFNYLFPGVLFIVFSKEMTKYSFLQENLIIGAFVYYFIGLVISRFGSLVIEPLLKKFSFIKFADYKEFISASKKDSNIDLFSEINNTYRTLISLFTLILLLRVYGFFEFKFPVLNSLNYYILLIALLIMFLFSYKKQTEFIVKRIKANI